MKVVKYSFLIIFGFLCILVFAACGTKPIVKDPSPAPIDTGYRRVETSVCGQWAVGENGCVFPGGTVKGSLLIYRVYEGEIQITGQGCSVDKKYTYSKEGGEWISIDLKALIGSKIENDCVLTIYQFPNLKGREEAQFPIRGMYGTVVLGNCPSGTTCSFASEQRRHGSSIPKWSPKVSSSGQLLLRGCGQEVIPPSSYQGDLAIDLRAEWPGGYPSTGKNGCTFILSVKGQDGKKFKLYRRVWLYKRETILLGAPSLSSKHVQADGTVSLSIVDGKMIMDNSFSYSPKAEGNYLRFYTSQGRSLVVKVKGGTVQWTQ